MFGVTEDQVQNEFLEMKLTRLFSIENDRRIVRERSVKLEPFPPGAFEKLLQNDIWEPVLQYLDHASLTSANTTCETFRNISEKDVFENILHILKQKNLLQVKFDPLNWNFPYFQKSSSDNDNHDILNLRRVSRSWREATDIVFMNEYGNTSPKDPYPWYFSFPRKSQDVFGRYPKVELPKYTNLKFTHQMCHTSQFARMLLQSVQFTVQTCLFASEVKFVEDFGATISGIYYGDCSMGRSCATKYRELAKVVKVAVGLKWMVVDMYTHCNDNDNSKELNDFLKDNPFPTNKSLEMIHFIGWGENELFVNEILRANSRVRSLMLPDERVDHETVVKNLDKVEQYHVRESGSRSMAIADETQFALLRSVTWNLKYLNIHSTHWTVNFSPERLFPIINRFTTLEYLHVDFDPSDIQDIAINLPNLKQFHHLGETWNWNAGVDFLLPCRALEDIRLWRVENNIANHDNVEHLVEFHGFVDRLESSNIWRWFPKLNSVTIKQLETTSKRLQYVRKGLSTVVREVAKQHG